MNSNMQWFVQALKTQLMHLPILMISLAAVVIAIVRWRRAPQACLFCLLGFGVIFFLSAVMPFVQYFLIMGPGRSGGSSGMGTLMTVMGVAWSGLTAVAYVLLAMAVFAGRSSPPEA
jgi:hypothetical protein